MINRYKLARTISGKTQFDVAIETGIYPHVISGIENGHRKPTPDVLAKLARAYGMTIEQIENLAIRGLEADETA